MVFIIYTKNALNLAKYMYVQTWFRTDKKCGWTDRLSQTYIPSLCQGIIKAVFSEENHVPHPQIEYISMLLKL